MRLKIEITGISAVQATYILDKIASAYQGELLELEPSMTYSLEKEEETKSDNIPDCFFYPSCAPSPSQKIEGETLFQQYLNSTTPEGKC